MSYAACGGSMSINADGRFVVAMSALVCNLLGWSACGAPTSEIGTDSSEAGSDANPTSDVRNDGAIDVQEGEDADNDPSRNGMPDAQDTEQANDTASTAAPTDSNAVCAEWFETCGPDRNCCVGVCYEG